MRQIFVVYETDAWHSLSHRECAGVFTSKWAAVNAIVKNHRIELDYQTQGYETNYDIEVWLVNDWSLL